VDSHNICLPRPDLSLSRVGDMIIHQTSSTALLSSSAFFSHSHSPNWRIRSGEFCVSEPYFKKGISDVKDQLLHKKRKRSKYDTCMNQTPTQSPKHEEVWCPLYQTIPISIVRANILHAICFQFNEIKFVFLFSLECHMSHLAGITTTYAA